MLTSPEQAINKTCLIGLSYFDIEENLLKQTMLAGTVQSVDSEMGISIELISSGSKAQEKAALFILPTNLSCWFIAPEGDFHTSQPGVKITNPDYLITWDIYQTKPQENDKDADGEQQWWRWVPRTEAPKIG